MTILGNIKALANVQEPLQIGMDNGAVRACIPIENKRQYIEVPADIVEEVDAIFNSKPKVVDQQNLD